MSKECSIKENIAREKQEKTYQNVPLDYNNYIQISHNSDCLKQLHSVYMFRPAMPYFFPGGGTWCLHGFYKGELLFFFYYKTKYSKLRQCFPP